MKVVQRKRETKPLCSLRPEVTTPIDIDSWDRREMWETCIEASVYQILNLQHPEPMTAEQIALALGFQGHSEITKEDVGNALYDGALRNYVYRTGEAPDRYWHLLCE